MSPAVPVVSEALRTAVPARIPGHGRGGAAASPGRPDPRAGCQRRRQQGARPRRPPRLGPPRAPTVPFFKPDLKAVSQTIFSLRGFAGSAIILHL